MIVITGAAGFIGSCLASKLNSDGFNNLVLVDAFAKHPQSEAKRRNYQGKTYLELVERDAFLPWLDKFGERVDFIFHLGARTDTAEFDLIFLRKINTDYSKEVWKRCVSFQIPLVYASSAATYGLGELGFEDSESIIEELKPLNPYGVSKNDFDIWVKDQKKKPFFWAGLKFFNVYGPNEYHKGRMASVILHTFRQIKETGKMRLFRSHNPEYLDGEQLRDFVYVKDVVEVCTFHMLNRQSSGLYNLGTGKARSFNDLATAVFKALKREPVISYIDTPIDIRNKYQYFTEAKMEKLRSIGYDKAFNNLESGVTDYVQNYLAKDQVW